MRRVAEYGINAPYNLTNRHRIWQVYCNPRNALLLGTRAGAKQGHGH